MPKIADSVGATSTVEISRKTRRTVIPRPTKMTGTKVSYRQGEP
jgi:hypothetical protein